MQNNSENWLTTLQVKRLKIERLENCVWLISLYPINRDRLHFRSANKRSANGKMKEKFIIHTQWSNPKITLSPINFRWCKQFLSIFLKKPWSTIEAGDVMNINNFRFKFFIKYLKRFQIRLNSHCFNIKIHFRMENFGSIVFCVPMKNFRKFCRKRMQCFHKSFFGCSRSAIVSRNKRNNATPSPNEWWSRNKIYILKLATNKKIINANANEMNKNRLNYELVFVRLALHHHCSRWYAVWTPVFPMMLNDCRVMVYCLAHQMHIECNLYCLPFARTLVVRV